MKARKVILAMGIIFAMIIGVIGTAYAGTQDRYVPVTLALKTKHGNDVYINTAIGFGGTGGGRGQLIYKIYAPNDSSFNKTVYCIRGGPGFGSTDWNAGNSSSPTSRVTYTQEFDLKRAIIDNSEIPSAYRSAIPAISSDNYKKLLWVLEHVYVPEATDAATMRRWLLNDAGLITYNSDGSINYETQLSDEDIDVIQQCAIWYFTNYGDADYSSDNFNLTLNDIPLGDIDSDVELDAYDLYRYFIEGANANYQDYEVELDGNGNVIATAPYRLKRTSPAIETQGNYKFAGPYRLIKTGNLLADNTFSIKNGTTPVSAQVHIKNSNGEYIMPSASQNIVDVMSNQDFYLRVENTTDISNLTVTLKTTYANTIAKYLSPDASTHNLDNEQPVVVIDKELITKEDSLNIQEEKEFDIALRKSISKLNEIAPTVNRLPQTDTTKLDAQTATTARYNHTKEALEADTNQYIEYTINLYNEGQKAGYASEIKDYLPEGIEFVELVNSPNYSASAQKQANGTTIVTITNTGKRVLAAYTGNGTLANESFTIRCKITKEAGVEDVRLVNIAEISKYYDSEEGTEVATDRDSQPANFPDSQKNNTYAGNGSDGSYVKGMQDDDDFEPIIIPGKEFDLALRKFIIGVNATELKNGDGTYTREPKVDVTGLVQGYQTDKNDPNRITTATYTHPKTPVAVSTGDVVTYVIRVYNEGKVDGYAKQITDHLPPELEFLPNDATNQEYGWTLDATDSSNRTIKTSYLANKIIGKFDGTTLKYVDLKIKCKVKENAESGKKITNIADITDYTDENGNTVTDRDSQKDNVTLPTDETLPEYSDHQQDDDDFEKVITKYFDLSLRKSITQINGVAPGTTRLPEVDTTKLANGTDTTAIYNHPKNDLETASNQYIEYTLTVYNEGQKNGYAAEIKDYLPAGIEFVELVNAPNYSASVAKQADGKSIVTITNTGKNVLNAYDGTRTLSKEAVTIRCKVTAVETTQDQRLVNIAEITKYFDSELGKEVTEDRDSQIANFPGDKKNNTYNGNGAEGEYVKGQQDDDDFEPVILKAKYFDLALRKFIIGVNGTELKNEDGTYAREPQVDVSTLLNGGTTATYNHVKGPISIAPGDEVTYIIRVYNEGQLDGYAKEITDHLPAELEFLPDDELNKTYGWTLDTADQTNRTVKTSYLKDTLLTKFNGTNLSYADIQIKCRVKTGLESNVKITNIADITNFTDENGNSVTDRDSQENNVVLPPDTELPNYKDEELGKEYIPGQQDDDDFEKLITTYFDLSLRKFIIGEQQELARALDGSWLQDEYLTDKYSYRFDREPQVDVTPLKTGSGTTAIYNHTKKPIEVSVGDTVTYMIRVYNEGNMNGFVTEITDHLPPQLEFLPEDPLNIKYLWTYEGADLRTVKSTYLKSNGVDDDNIIRAFDGYELDYIQIPIRCKVVKGTDKKITNIADITGFTDENGNTVIDRDSQEDNVVLPADKDLPGYKDTEIDRLDTYIPGQQDDDDFEKVYIRDFDLALRKFITEVNDTLITNRVPVFSIDKDGNYIYTHTKEPVIVETTDIVTYTLRIFNEGEQAGYAAEIKDDIPEGLEFLPEHNTNTTYRWVMLDANGQETTNISEAVTIKTDYLSKEQEATPGENLLAPFDKETMESPDYRDVKVAFKVVAPETTQDVIINKAQISDDTDENGNPVEDKDSVPDIWTEGEDDQDIEKIVLKYFDLALRKFITGVDETAITNRYPVFSIDENGKYIYTHTKEPVEVENGNIVTYTLRIYNEGTQAGYATQVKDDIPEGLEFLPEHATNTEHRWIMLDAEGNETTEVSKAKFIMTDYLSKAQADATGRNNLLKPFNKETMQEPDYRDIKIAFKVTEPNTSDRILINYAQISEDENEEGKPVVDIDSTPDKWIEGEDDQDIEKVKVKYFDLALRKWVTQAIITEKGEVTVIESGHTAEDDPEEVLKVDLNRKKLNSVKVQFRYSIRVTNEGEIAGYAEEVKDYVPQGLKFVAEDNPLWTEISPNVIVTDQLKNTLLQPGESATVEVLLTWINSEDNLGLQTNVAEISKDKNDSNTPDIDSTPDNKKDGEDDIDDAPTIITIITGAVASYLGITTIVVTMLAGGIILIRKYVI